MFKLVLLSALLAVAAARPSLLHGDGGHASFLLAAPAHVVHEPVLTKVGAIVKHIPTAVSHQSSSVVHSSAHVVQPILAPALKTTYHAAAPLLHAAPLYAAPALHHHAAAALPLAHAWPGHGWAGHGWAGHGW